MDEADKGEIVEPGSGVLGAALPLAVFAVFEAGELMWEEEPEAD